MVDLDKLETLLKVAAKERRSMTYSDILFFFERRTTPITVRALCRDLSLVCEKLEADGWPEPACLVVRKSDRLPGDGYFKGLEDDDGSPLLPDSSRARLLVNERQEAVFEHAERCLS